MTMSWLTMRKILLAAPLLAGILFSRDGIAANCTANQRKSWFGEPLDSVATHKGIHAETDHSTGLLLRA